MSGSDRERDPPASSGQLPAATPSPQPALVVSPTRWSRAWLGVCAAALAAVALIVFMLQNTRSVEVTFLWMHGTLPLALALLIAAVGAAILVMVFGVGRITQLRRMARRKPGPQR